MPVPKAMAQDRDLEIAREFERARKEIFQSAQAPPPVQETEVPVTNLDFLSLSRWELGAALRDAGRKPKTPGGPWEVHWERNLAIWHFWNQESDESSWCPPG